MLKQVIDFINCNIKSLDLVGKTYGLCEVIKGDQILFPAIYFNGELKKITDVDYFEGIIYHRLRSAYTESANDEQSTSSCGRYIERTYPLKAIVIVKKSLKGDDNYSDEKIASIISNKISFRNDTGLRRSIKADTIEGNIYSVNTNRDEVFSQEFKGMDQFIKLEYCLLSIEYNIIIGSDVSCFNDC